MELHQYQIEVVKDIQGSWAKHRRILLQMPTGTGKTHVFCEIIRQHREEHRGKRILVLTHKRELVRQTFDRLRRFGIMPGVILSGHQESPEHQVQVATVQSLIQRVDRINFLSNLSLIVVDEAHHTPSDTYLKLIDFYSSKETHLLGVTATPRRSDGKGFDDVFDHLVQSWQIRRFIKEGFLADVIHRKTGTYADTKKELEKLDANITTEEDYDIEALDRVMRSGRIMADAVLSYKRYRGQLSRSIVFPVTVAHSKELVQHFWSEGVPAAHIDGNTDHKTRNRILEDFANGAIKVLCNVGIVTEGFDCPDAEIVQLLRPTKSITLYLQQVGRILRRKQDGRSALILDSACCYDEFGSVKADRRWSLDPGVNARWPEGTEEPGDRALEPNMGNLPMPVVDSLLPCPLYTNGKAWINELANIVKVTTDLPLYENYFKESFAHFPDDEQRCRAIHAATGWHLWGLPVKTISPFSELVNTEVLNITKCPVESLRPIMKLSKLTALYAGYTSVKTLRLPNHKTNLRRLNISNTRITDASIVSDYPNLERLLINGLSLDDKTYDKFKNLKRLQRFSAMGSNFRSLHCLIGSKDTLEILELSNSNLIDLEQIHHFQNLRYLDISGTQVSSLGWLSRCRSLETLVIKGVSVSNNEKLEIENRFPVVWVED